MAVLRHCLAVIVIIVTAAVAERVQPAHELRKVAGPVVTVAARSALLVHVSAVPRVLRLLGRRRGRWQRRLVMVAGVLRVLLDVRWVGTTRTAEVGRGRGWQQELAETASLTMRYLTVRAVVHVVLLVLRRSWRGRRVSSTRRGVGRAISGGLRAGDDRVGQQEQQRQTLERKNRDNGFFILYNEYTDKFYFC